MCLHVRILYVSTFLHLIIHIRKEDVLDLSSSNYFVLGDTHTCAIASRTWIWKTLHACMGQINSSSVLANCEIAQLQQTTEILQQSYITQILYKLLYAVLHLMCGIFGVRYNYIDIKYGLLVIPLIYDLITKVNTSHMATQASIADICMHFVINSHDIQDP